MESNITEHPYFGSDLELSEPHFDDETTVLSARRVVPLGDVRPQRRFGRSLAFGLAMVVAAIVGAVGTTLIYRASERQASAIEDKGTPIPQRDVTSGRPLSAAAGAVSDSGALSTGENMPHADTHSTDEQDETGASEMRKSASESRKSAPVLSQRVKSARATDPLQDETGQETEDSWQNDREMRHAERMEERRLRRETRREAKREAGDHRDDLLRIREIFEGPPKP